MFSNLARHRKEYLLLALAFFYCDLSVAKPCLLGFDQALENLIETDPTLFSPEIQNRTPPILPDGASTKKILPEQWSALQKNPGSFKEIISFNGALRGYGAMSGPGKGESLGDGSGDFSGARKVKIIIEKVENGRATWVTIDAAEKIIPILSREDYIPAEMTRVAAEKGLGPKFYGSILFKTADGGLAQAFYSELIGGGVGEKAVMIGLLEPDVNQLNRAMHQPWQKAETIRNKYYELSDEDMQKFRERREAIRKVHPDGHVGNILVVTVDGEFKKVDGKFQIFGVDWDNPSDRYRERLKPKLEHLEALP